MKRGLYVTGALVLLTFLLTPAFGVEWVDVGGKPDPAMNPQRVTAPAPVAVSNTVTAGQVSPNQGDSPGLDMPALDYVYIDPPLYTIYQYPWYPCNTGMRFQTLWLKEDINRPGKIHELALYKSYYPSYYNATFDNVVVKMCNTTLTNLGSSFSGNYGGATPVTVFSASELFRGIYDGSNYWGWDTITLQTDFDYDETKSLLVEVTWHGDQTNQCVYSWATYQSGKYHMAYYTDYTSDYCYTAAYKFNTRIGFVPPGNDVGVSKITQPSDPFSAYGDTLFPACEVKSYGAEVQNHVPVIAKFYEGGIAVYDETTYTDLEVGEVDTLYFPGFAPPAEDRTYLDSMFTANPGDVRQSNDASVMTFYVTQWGSLCKAYHNGSFDNAISWVNHGWWATKYATVSGAQINGMNYWTSSFGGADYDQRAQLYLDDAGGVPGTLLYDTAVVMHTAIWTNMYKNHYDIAPQTGITTDSFFVAVDETEWTVNGQYCYFGMCYVNPIPGVDYGKYGSGGWGKFSYGGDINFGFDYCFSSPLIDAACVDISSPPAVVDSNTTFQATFAVKNVGLHTRQHVPYQFHIVNDATNDTILQVSGDAGQVLPGQVKSFTDPTNLTPLPGHYTMTGITNVMYDYQFQNDTFVAPLFVRYVDVKTEIVSPRMQEVPGLVAVQVRLVNNGNVPAEVPRVDVTILPSGYSGYLLDIPSIPVGGSQLVTLTPWVCPSGGKETATAWITYPADMNHGTVNDGIWNDTATRPITTGIPGWSEMTPVPAPLSGKAVKDGGCLAYDALTELIYASKGNKSSDFYAYSVPTGTWATKTGIPLGAEGKYVYKGSVICSDGNGMLYLTKGNNTVGFWAYDAALNTWTPKAFVPLGSSGKKVKQGAGLAWGTKLGHGYAYLLKGYRNEFHKYDPVTNAWIPLLDAPIGTAGRMKWDAGSWLVADPNSSLLYAHKAKYHEMYVYDTEADTWSKAKAAMPIPGSAGAKKAKDGSCAAWYSGKIYSLKGGNTTEFWRYFPLGDTWHKQDDIPLMGVSGSRKKVKAGGALAGYPGTGVYAFKGNKSLEYWRYTPYDVAAGAQPSREGIMAGNSDIGNVSFAIAPNPLSGGLATVRYSLPKAGLATLYVYDVTGRTVLTQTMAAGRTGTAGLDLRKLEAGVYLVKVTTEGFSATQKLVVEH